MASKLLEFLDDGDEDAQLFPSSSSSPIHLFPTLPRRLKVHYRAPPDIRGSGKERGHGTELQYCPRCGKELKAGKHHVGCFAGRSAPRQAAKRFRLVSGIRKFFFSSFVFSSLRCLPLECRDGLEQRSGYSQRRGEQRRTRGKLLRPFFLFQSRREKKPSPATSASRNAIKKKRPPSRRGPASFRCSLSRFASPRG